MGGRRDVEDLAPMLVLISGGGMGWFGSIALVSMSLKHYSSQYFSFAALESNC